MLPRCKNFDDFAQVRTHIMMFDDELCSETFLSNLKTYIVSKDDDLKIMKKYQDGPVEACLELDTPEQFIIEVKYIYINSFTNRLKLNISIDVSYVPL